MNKPEGKKTLLAITYLKPAVGPEWLPRKLEILFFQPNRWKTDKFHKKIILLSPCVNDRIQTHDLIIMSQVFYPYATAACLIYYLLDIFYIGVYFDVLPTTVSSACLL